MAVGNGLLPTGFVLSWLILVSQMTLDVWTDGRYVADDFSGIGAGEKWCSVLIGLGLNALREGGGNLDLLPADGGLNVELVFPL